MAGNVAGVVSAKVDGVDYGTQPGATLSLGDDAHTPVFASGKFQGTYASPGNSRFSGAFTYKRSNSLETMRTAIQAGAAFEYTLDTGDVYVVSEVYNGGDVSLGGEGAGMTIELLGPPAVKA